MLPGRMSDRDLRELERRFVESDAAADEERWLLARVRAGELAPLDLAAHALRLIGPGCPDERVEDALRALAPEHPTLSWGPDATWEGSDGQTAPAWRLRGPSEALLARGLGALQVALPALREVGRGLALRRVLVAPAEVSGRYARVHCLGSFAQVGLWIGPGAAEDGLELVCEEEIARRCELEPALLAGVREGLLRAQADGLGTGAPFGGIVARVLDARVHPVDSNAQAFARAARLALARAVDAHPLQVLEPTLEVELSAASPVWLAMRLHTFGALRPSGARATGWIPLRDWARLESAAQAHGVSARVRLGRRRAAAADMSARLLRGGSVSEAPPG